MRLGGPAQALAGQAAQIEGVGVLRHLLQGGVDVGVGFRGVAQAQVDRAARQQDSRVGAVERHRPLAKGQGAVQLQAQPRAAGAGRPRRLGRLRIELRHPIEVGEAEVCLAHVEIDRTAHDQGQAVIGIDLQKAVDTLKLQSEDDLLISIGYGKVLPTDVIDVVVPEDKRKVVEELRTLLGRQDIQIFGDLDPQTRVARVLVEADYRMKLIGIGVEKPPVNMVSYVDRATGSWNAL